MSLESNIFAGAGRVHSYGEPATEPKNTLELVQPPATSEEVISAGEVTDSANSGQIPEVPETPGMSADITAYRAIPEVTKRVPGTWGWRGWVSRASGGLLTPSAGQDELEHLENIRVIRQATWTRSVNIVIANDKGSSGKTPTTIITAGILAMHNDGWVTAFEATEDRGYLADHAEGNAARGIAELIADAEHITSAGALKGYTAPQTSRAAVIGSVYYRRMMTVRDVYTIRGVLDRYCTVTLADSGNNHLCDTFLALVDTADTLVVPMRPTFKDLEGAIRTIRKIKSRGPHGAQLVKRAVVIITHDGGRENPGAIDTAKDVLLNTFGVLAVHEVPFDEAIAMSKELSVPELSQNSIQAWTAAVASVTSSLLAAPAEPLININQEKAPS